MIRLAPRCRRLGWAALPLALVALVAAAPAGALIVPQRGIAGVALGMTPAQVRGKLGKPLKLQRGKNIFGPWTTYRYRGLAVSFQGNRRVTAISTTARRERTRRGVGVGSTEAQVRTRLPRVHCETIVGMRHCYVGSYRPGTRVTDFLIRRGRVVRVVIGFVID